jgi:hypothetical protein
MCCENPQCQCEHCRPDLYEKGEIMNKEYSNRDRNVDEQKHIHECACGGECSSGSNDTQDMGSFANQGFARDDRQTATRLLDKNWSPLLVRKYQMEGWPLFISLICDANLNDLDQVVYEIHEEAVTNGFTDGKIQSARNYCGFMSDQIKKHYDDMKKGCVEGVAILWYVDKCFISSLYGDFMTHESCKLELYQIINTLPHI